MAVLFASGEPIPVSRLAQVFDCDDAAAHWMMRRIKDYFDELESPLQVLRLDDQYQMATREEFQEPVKKALEIKKSQPLSQAAMEVLAIVAYNQPVTKSFVEQIRGVDSSSTVNTLVERGLLEEKGRLDLPGRPDPMDNASFFAQFWAGFRRRTALGSSKRRGRGRTGRTGPNRRNPILIWKLM